MFVSFAKAFQNVQYFLQVAQATMTGIVTSKLRREEGKLVNGRTFDGKEGKQFLNGFFRKAGSGQFFFYFFITHLVALVDGDEESRLIVKGTNGLGNAGKYSPMVDFDGVVSDIESLEHRPDHQHDLGLTHERICTDYVGITLIELAI